MSSRKNTSSSKGPAPRRGLRKDEVDQFEKLAGQLLGLYEEMSLLSKKSPNDAVNRFKLKFINRHLSDSNEFLKEKYIPFGEFTQFSEDDIPQNSDVVFILSQYLQCLEKYRADHVTIRNGAWFWKVEGDANDKADEYGLIYLRTSKPKQLRE